MHKKNRKIKTSRVICLSLFVTVAAVLILCFITEASLWVDTTAMTILYAKIFVGACILSLLLLSLMVSIFFKKLSLDKKILILLGLLAIGLGILGISSLVFKNEMSFIDAIYKIKSYLHGIPEFELDDVINRYIKLL